MSETYYDKDGVEIKVNKSRSKIAKKISGITPLVALGVFLGLGFFVPGAWSYCWVVFLAIPVVEVLMSAITQEGKARVVSLTAICSVALYIGLGFFLTSLGEPYANLCWLKLLIVYLIIPIVAIIAE